MTTERRWRFILVSILLGVLLFGCELPSEQAPTATTTSETIHPPIEDVVTATSTEEAVLEPADVIFYNGTLLTMEDGFPEAEAIAIRGEWILAVGSNEDILGLADSETQLIDLAGQTLMPGLADGHMHMFWVPQDMTLDEVQDVILSYGFTSVAEMTSSDDHLARLMHAEEGDLLRVRVNVFPNYNNSRLDENGNMVLTQYWYPENGPILDSDRMLRIPGIKIFVDGAGIPGRGCPAQREPYPAETMAQDWFWDACLSEYGELYWSQTELNQVVAAAQAAGFRVAFHAMGDRGIETALNAITFALNGQRNSAVRHQIQHSSLLEEDLLQRYIDEDILSSVRGHFNTCDQDTYWSHAAANRYALPRLGVHAYLETDAGWRGDPENPYWSRTINSMVQLYGLVTHQQLTAGGACLPDPWIAQHVITVDQALYMMTYEPAYAVSQEDVLGSLTPGKYADLIILSADPHDVDPKALRDLDVWMTMVGGRVEFCAAGHEALCPGLSPISAPDQADEGPTPIPPDPVELKLYRPEHNVAAGTPILLTIGWATDTEEQVADFLSAISLTGTLDGQPLSGLDDHWGNIEAFDSSYGEDQDYVSHWLYPLGVLEPGTHVVEIHGVVAWPVTDGFDTNGDGVPDEYSGEVLDYSLTIVVAE